MQRDKEQVIEKTKQGLKISSKHPSQPTIFAFHLHTNDDQ